MTTHPDPQTVDQWQEAVDWAELLLLLDSAKQFGLITGGPTINSERCEFILKAGATRGVRPRKLSQEELCQALRHL